MVVVHTTSPVNFLVFYFLPKPAVLDTSHRLDLIIICILNPINVLHKLLETPPAISEVSDSIAADAGDTGELSYHPTTKI